MQQDPLVLDPTARRRGEEEKVLHLADGPVLVDILGELAWAVADPDLLASLLADPRVSKDPRQHWPRFIAGEIVGKWPLYLQVSVDNMFTAYGNAHRRLRRLVARRQTWSRSRASSATGTPRSPSAFSRNGDVTRRGSPGRVPRPGGGRRSGVPLR
jgi:hypothetical protein